MARLGTAIRIGVLTPGTRLPPERDLAEQLGISRSTLRQALGTLTQTGHLIAVRGRSGGTFVASEPPIASGELVPAGSWRTLMGWRMTIELGAVYLACDQAQDADLERLELAVQAGMASLNGDWPAYRRADVFFHLAIAEASGNPRVVDAMTEVHGEITELLGHIAHPSLVLRHAVEQHMRIVERLRARDAPGAAAALREHLDGTIRIIEGLLPQRNTSAA